LVRGTKIHNSRREAKLKKKKGKVPSLESELPKSTPELHPLMTVDLPGDNISDEPNKKRNQYERYEDHPRKHLSPKAN
jgi:hypothetical protein